MTHLDLKCSIFSRVFIWGPENSLQNCMMNYGKMKKRKQYKNKTEPPPPRKATSKDHQT